MEENRNYVIFGNYSLDGNVDVVISNCKIYCFVPLIFYYVNYIFTVKFPLHYEIIELTSEYIIIVACSDCGFFSKEGAGCMFNFFLFLNS